MLGNGDGTFRQITKQQPRNVVSWAVGDFNEDGHLDLVGLTFDTELVVLLGNGDGTFQAAQDYAAGEGPWSVAVGDFNGDGHLDLAVADLGDSSGNGSGVSILLGRGNGTFEAPRLYPVSGSPSR